MTIHELTMKQRKLLKEGFRPEINALGTHIIWVRRTPAKRLALKEGYYAARWKQACEPRRVFPIEAERSSTSGRMLIYVFGSSRTFTPAEFEFLGPLKMPRGDRRGLVKKVRVKGFYAAKADALAAKERGAKP